MATGGGLHPEEVKKVCYDLEVSPSCHQEGSAGIPAGQMPGGKSAASEPESGFHGASKGKAHKKK